VIYLHVTINGLRFVDANRSGEGSERAEVELRTPISRIKGTVNYQLRLNPAFLYFPCSRFFAWIFPPAGLPRYNEDFPLSLVGEPPWTPPSN
jgi:hypothetical protein